MTQLIRLPLLWIAMLTLVGCACTSQVDLFRVVTSGRDGWQQPELVIEALAISPGQRVAEIGAGDGYWIAALSQAVGEAGRVYAVEVDAEKVASLEDLVTSQGLTNVRVILGDYDDPQLPDENIDLAITSLTYHHIDDRVHYFARLRSDLAPGGRVAHLDDRDDLPVPVRWFPTPGHTQNVDEMEAEMAAAGYRKLESFDFLLVQAFHIYGPETDLVGRVAD